jgi:hypothetical protein
MPAVLDGAAGCLQQLQQKNVSTGTGCINRVLRCTSRWASLGLITHYQQLENK